MSAPTRQLRSLSIHGDPPDNSGSEANAEGNPSARERKAHTTTALQRMRRDSRPQMMDMSAVVGSSGLTYDLSQSGLDVETRARAVLGLTTGFDVLWCSSSRWGYEFILGERVRVCVGSDSRSGSNGSAYTCSCAAFRGRPDVACQHIFWLLDQLHGQVVSISSRSSPPPSPPPHRILLSHGGHARSFARIEHLLGHGSLTLETLADLLNWPYVRSEAEGGMTRTQRVRDILSAFSADVLPGEFRMDLAEDDEDDGDEEWGTTRRRTPEQCVVQGDFEATLFRLAVHDDGVYASLCKAMPPGACAAIYFDKALERSRKLLADFDRFCLDYGQPGCEIRANNFTIDSVLEDVQASVDNIHENILSRSPHGTLGAAKALVAVLEDISNRNKDALDNNRHGQTSFANEDEDNRNIYHQLIGKTDETGKYFVLDALGSLSGRDLHQFKDRLRAVLQKNEVNRAPRDYILKLGALLGAVEAAETGTDTDGSRGLGRKRAVGGQEGAESEGGGKRLR
ncbi:uncharacterized protein BJX67DRAFT_375906 [Aspergillus lucknowensis]|uniref:SWIM-type domain-containing protein n=1 Tax=Aspergillus lucknowensis TaxID=176173 RepID=A0ABR4L8F3_9EURO